MVSQIIFLREFLVVFYGNEISIGIILASWLIWGSFGSWFLGRYSDRVKPKLFLFSSCQFLLAFILPLTILAIRSSKAFMGISTGEIVGFYSMALASFLILAFSCSILGFMFSLACRLYRSEEYVPAKGVARVYVLESIGALTGGFLVSYFLIRYMRAYDIIFALSFLNILFSIAIQRHVESMRAKKVFYGLTLLVLVLFTAGILSGAGDSLRQYSIKKLWEGYDVLGSKDSVYGNITVTETSGQISFYENGLNLYTVPDPFSAEESVHYAMLENKSPESILLIGGGVGGLLKEILRYPVKKIDYVELDPTIIKMAEEYLKKEDSEDLKNPVINIINADGRFYVKNTREKYDCVIIHLGDPFTAQLNRFYTVGFFEELADILNKGGVVSFGLTSSANYISEELKRYLRSVYLSAKEVFPDIFIVPGNTAYFLLSNKKGMLTGDPDILMRRLKERGVQTEYVREYYLFDGLSKERVEYLKKNIEERIDVRLNMDFKPVSYYYATVFWSTHFDIPFFRKFLSSIDQEKIWLAIVLFCVLLGIIVMINRRRRGKRAVMAAIMTTGFAEINFQIAVILSFQIIYGYVFYKLGVIITSFMVGLAIGGWAIGRNIEKIKDEMKVFRWTQVSICLYPLILPPVFMYFSKTTSSTASWIGSNIVFTFLPVIAGTIGGIQFPLANKIYLENREETGRVAGLSYGLDLLGACLGSFLAAAFLVPILGIFETCFLAAFINTIVLILLTILR